MNDMQPVEATEKPKKEKVKRYKITFHGEGGDVEICHNYKLNVYQRNVETEIDEHFLHALKLAVVNTFTKVDGVVKPITIPMFQYTVEPI
jgi:hypothetical protein